MLLHPVSVFAAVTFSSGFEKEPINEYKNTFNTSRETFTRTLYIDSHTRGDSFDEVVAAAFSTTKPGDLDSDGKVSIFDYNLLVAGFGTKYNIFDYNILVANYGR